MPGDPVVGSTVLRRPAIQSPNFVHGSAGWNVASDGSAEFNSVTIRGSFEAGTDPGPNVQIDTFGELLFFDSGGNLVMVMNPARKAFFIYSPGGGAGNLVASSAAAGGTDAYGNQFLAGACSYGATFASQLAAGFVTMYHGSQAGGWTTGATMETDVSGDLLLIATKVLTGSNTLDDGAGNMTVAGSLSVNGSTSTASAGLTDGTINGSSSTTGLPNGGIVGTSGGASAGTAHTHGPGSYSVSNGQHSHASGSYAVANGSHGHVL